MIPHDIDSGSKPTKSEFKVLKADELGLSYKL